MSVDLSGLTDDQLEQLIHSRLQGNPIPDTLGDSDRGSAMGAFSHGASMGASDYAGAAGRYLGDQTKNGLSDIGLNVKPTDESFNDDLKGVRADNDAYLKENPVVGRGMEALGMIGTPELSAAKAAWTGGKDIAAGGVIPAISQAVDTGLGKLFGRQTQYVTQVPRLTGGAPKIVDYATQGGIGGGLYGIGNARGDDGGLPTGHDLLNSGVGDAAAGVVGGTTLPYVAKGVAAGGGMVGDLLQGAVDKLPFRQTTVGGRRLAQDLQMDNITPDQLAANRNLLGPRSNFVDAAGMRDPETGVWLGGKNTYREADALANMRGPTQDLAERVLKPRPAVAGSEIMDSVRRNLAPGDGLFQTLDDIANRQATEASPNFQAAFKANKSISDPAIDRVLNTPAGQEAMNYARTRMQNRMSKLAVPDPELTSQYNDLVAAGKMDPGQIQGGVGSGLKLETLDLIRQDLGQQLAQKRIQVATGNAKPSEASDLADLYGDLRGALVKNDVTAQAGPNSLKAEGGQYEQGLNKAAGLHSLKEASQSGRDFMSGDRQITAKDFNDLTDSEKEVFRQGAALEVQKAIEKTGTVPQSLKNILNPQSGQRKLMQQIFPNFDGFLNDVAGTVRKLQSTRMVGGSDTFARQSNAGDLGLDLGGAAIEGLKGNAGDAALGTGRAILNYLKRPSAGAMQEQGDLLLNPARFDDALAAVRSRYQAPRPTLDLLRPSSGSIFGVTPSLMSGPSNQQP